MTGALLWEVSGNRSAEKADALAAKLRRVLNPMGVRVDRPNKKAELRLVGIEGSATSKEVAGAIANMGGCAVDDVRIGSSARH